MRNVLFVFVATLSINCTSNGATTGGSGGSGAEGGTPGTSTGSKGGSGGTGSGSKTGGTVGTTGTGGTGTGGTAAGGTNSTPSGGTAGTAMGGTSGTPVVLDFTKPPGCLTIAGVVRDFVSTHPDFEFPTNMPAIWPMGILGMVEPALGADKKPVLTATGAPIPAGIASSKESFNQWFNDAPGVNMTVPIQMEVKQVTATTWEYGPTTIDGFFFPINTKGFGNIDLVLPDAAGDPLEAAADRANNQLFTLEVQSEFLYQGGKNELLNFRTDDDSWVFINNKLAIDDGGLKQDPSVLRLDEVATKLGLEPGKRYPISIFFADRQLVNAIFAVSSNIIWTGCAK
jgi:fibro-slime domain-containing protein